MQISVLIVSYNVRGALVRCLSSLPQTAEIIVVDNASRDGSADMVRQDFPHVKIIASSHNRGFSAGVNEAARHAGGDVFFLLNPDAYLAPGQWSQLLQAVARRPHAWAIGCRQVNLQGSFQLALGPNPSLLGELARRTVQRRLDRGCGWVGRCIDGLLRWPTRVSWVAGSSLLVRREAFAQVQGFDEKYFLYFEDIDFCLRLRHAGGTIYYDPTVTVVHQRGASALTAPVAAQQAYRRSQLLFWRQHRGSAMAHLVASYLRLRGWHPQASS